MSVQFTILKELKPRKFERIFQRDLLFVLNKAKRLGQFKTYDEMKRVIREGVFLAFLGGKIQAARDLRERTGYSLGNYDFYTIQFLRTRFYDDTIRILTDLFTQREPDLTNLRNRIKIVGTVATWTSYNKGKISTFRQRAEGKLGHDKYFYGQEEIMEPLVYWVTAGDERVCPICMDLDGQEFPLFSPALPEPGAIHPNCRCEWMSVEVHRWRKY